MGYFFRSQYFLFKNGVKQGRVLSFNFFNIYIYIYKPLVIGRPVGNAYIGALSYGNDITLLCPSVRGMNEIIVLCCEYQQEYDITFNPKTTVCIKF